MKQMLFLFLILLGLFNFYGQTDNKDYTAWWIFNHGDYAQTANRNDLRVNWAFEVFERVKNVADKIMDWTPRLFIIRTRIGPYALSLPDGGIIINPRTLDICYDGEDRRKCDSRLAFILGHELAHLANQDFLHRQAFLALKEYGDKKAKKELIEYFHLSDPEKAREFKKRELFADQKGMLYAVMAGFEVGELFREKSDFLTYWAKQTGIGMSYDDDPRHPSLEKRLKFIRVKQNEVVSQLELFRAGVLLYQMGNYRDAEAAFHEFSKIYPAREVFNNIGACYFNLARRLLHLRFSEDYYRFRLSTTIADETSAVKMHPRGEGDYLKDKEIYRSISKAEGYFRLAVDRDRYDTACRNNLAAALILRKKYADALAICTSILEKYPEDIKAVNNKAIAFYLYGKEEDLETTPKAMHMLKTAYQANPGNFEVLYNLAALKQERERLAGANVYWETYLELPDIPVDNYYKYIYKKLKKEILPTPVKDVHLPGVPNGIRLGEDIRLLEKKWGKKSIRGFTLGSEEGSDSDQWYLKLSVILKDKVRIIALDEMIELVEMELPVNKGVKEIFQEFGPPQRIVNHSSGNFYVYKDMGFSVKEIKGRIFSYIWFEKGF